jgi:cation transport ATPase
VKEHEHASKNKPEDKPGQDEVAKKAYDIFLKEGRPQGRADQNWSEAEAKLKHTGSHHHDHHGHDAHMTADFRKRFWISLVLTLPILVLSPLLQTLVGLSKAIRFSGDLYVLFGLSSAVFWYGGWPFVKGLFKELKSLQPAMMTLVAVAITTAYLYSNAVVFGLAGKMFFWELATGPIGIHPSKVIPSYSSAWVLFLLSDT